MDLFLIKIKIQFYQKNAEDPISLSYPFILKKSKNEYLIWYGSTISWDCGNGEMLHIIKGAFSKDGIHWDSNNSSLKYSIGKATSIF